MNHSEFNNDALSLAIISGKETAAFLIDGGKVTVSTEEEKADCTVEGPLCSLNPLVTGYKNIYELMDKKETTIHGDRAIIRNSNCIQIVNVLFPKGTPYGSNLPLVWE